MSRDRHKTPLVMPTMTPLEAQLVNLEMICRKAMDGLDSPGEPFPRGWIYPQISGISCPTASSRDALLKMGVIVGLS